MTDYIHSEETRLQQCSADRIDIWNGFPFCRLAFVRRVYDDHIVDRAHSDTRNKNYGQFWKNLTVE